MRKFFLASSVTLIAVLTAPHAMRSGVALTLAESADEANVYSNVGSIMVWRDPNNPLGERWIELGGGMGIHGTNDPQTYQSDGGRGMIRLSPRDAEDVFDIVTVGSQVVIRP